MGYTAAESGATIVNEPLHWKLPDWAGSAHCAVHATSVTPAGAVTCVHSAGSAVNVAAVDEVGRAPEDERVVTPRETPGACEKSNESEPW
jgi:hypothetical protein